MVPEQLVDEKYTFQFTVTGQRGTDRSMVTAHFNRVQLADFAHIGRSEKEIIKWLMAIRALDNVHLLDDISEQPQKGLARMLTLSRIEVDYEGYSFDAVFELMSGSVSLPDLFGYTDSCLHQIRQAVINMADFVRYTTAIEALSTEKTVLEALKGESDEKKS